MTSNNKYLNPNSSYSSYPNRWRFCRANVKDHTPESPRLAAGADEAHFFDRRLVVDDLVRSLQEPVSLESAYEAPGRWKDKDNVGPALEARLVRYQPVIAMDSGDSEFFARYKPVITVAILLLVAYCLFQLPTLLREIRIADETKSSAVESLALSLEREDKSVDATKADLKNLSLRMSHLRSSGGWRRFPQGNPRLSEEDDILADLRKMQSSKRSIVHGSAAQGSKEQFTRNTRREDQAAVNVALEKQGDQASQPAQANFTFNSAVPLVPGAVVHRNETGDADYWLIQRPGDETMTKVIPLDATTLGVLVHRIEDDRNYILTMEGGWMAGN